MMHHQLWFLGRGQSRFVSSLALILIISVGFLSPVSVFAEESQPQIPQSSKSETSTTEQSSQTQSVSRDTSIKGGKTTDAKISGGATMSSLSGGSSPYRDNSNDVINGPRFNTDILSGALQYEVPLTVPPGRNRLTPDIKLVYSSQVNDNTSPYGYGWSDNIPYIERINRKGTDKLYTENYFLSTLDGELKANDSVATTSYGARVENGNFNQYTFISNNKWLVTDKFGTTYKFGYSTSTQLYDTASSTRIYRWMLEEMRDANANYIKYEYYHDGNAIYPSRIVYTGNNTTDGIFEISFSRESRTDIATSSKPAFQVVSKYRISEIQAKINGTWARKYVLGYTTSDNGNRSLLQSVTESSQDESSNVITLPATTFTYSVSNKGWTPAPNSWNLPENLTITTGDNGVRLVDFNGDGLVYVLRSVATTSTTTQSFYVNNTNGWSTSTGWYLPKTTGESQFADVNGDNLADVIWADMSGDNLLSTIYLHNGSGWTASTTWSFPKSLLGSGGTDNGVRIVDIDGDGLPDVLYSRVIPNGSGGFTSTSTTFLHTGSGWATSTSWSIPVDFVTNSGGAYGVRFLDVNGDGLIDILSDSGTYINNASGWSLDLQWASPLSPSASGVRYLDINGDGLIDILRSSNSSFSGWLQSAYINNGHGWTQDNAWIIDESFTEGFTGADLGTRFEDVNGDGTVDVIQAYNGAKATWFNNNSVRADLLTGINLSAGASTTVTYQGSALYNNGTSTNPGLPLNFDTVKKIVINDGLGNLITTTYFYEGGDYYHTGPFDRQLAGFQKITEYDAASTSIKTFYQQGNSTDSANGESLDGFSKIGKPYRIEVADSLGNIYTKTVNQWATSSLANGREFVQLARKTELTYDGDSDHKDKAEEYTYNAANGNLTQKIEWGEVLGNNDGTFSDTNTDKFTTTIAYAASSTSNFVGLPSQESVVDQSSNKVKESKYYYDTLVLNSVNKGNLTKKEDWKSGTSYASSTKTYNSYGLINSETDPRSKTTTYTFDTYNLYVSTSTNPLSQTVGYLYDYSNGKPKQVIDANSRTFQTVYDALDRVKEEKQPDIASPSTLVTKTLYTYTDSGLPRKTQKTTYLNSATSTDAYIYVDGLGRLVQERIEAEADNMFIVRDVGYNNRGLKNRESLPYFGPGSGTTTAISTAALYTSYVYDPLQRITDVGNALGTTTNTYDDWKTTTTDADGKIKDYYTDAYKNLIQVDEHNGGSTYSTAYQYTYLGNVTKITDALGNIRNFTYDGLGRRLTTQDLHASTDSTYGTWFYTYDDAGNLTAMTDPKSQNYAFGYDNLSRVSWESYTSLPGNEVIYSYDSCANGKGKICKGGNTGTATTTYNYNALGLVETETQKYVGGYNATTTYSYDRSGNVTNIVYPDGSQVAYVYNTAGLLESISRKESSDANFSALVTNLDYAPNGKIKLKEFANGVKSIYTYDPDKLYRLTNIQTVTTLGVGGDMDGAGTVSSEEFAQLLAQQDTAPTIDTVADVTSEVIAATTTEDIIPAGIPNETAIATSTATTTEQTPIPENTPAKLSTTTEEMASTTTQNEPVVYPIDAPHLKLKVPVEKILGKKEFSDGVVKYAYKTDTRVKDIPAEDEVLKEVKKKGLTLGSEVIEKRTEHSRTYATSDPKTFVLEAISGSPQYFEDENGEWWQVDYATTTKESFDFQTQPKKKNLLEEVVSFFFPALAHAEITSTFYPDSSTVDGSLGRFNVDENWATIKSGAGTNVDNLTNATYETVNIASQDGATTNWKHMRRSIYLFDTSSIPDGHAVIGGSFSIWGQSGTVDDYHESISLVTTNPASNTTLVASDYSTFGSTKLANDVPISSFSGGYNTWTLNSSGFAAISTTGITKLGLRISSEIDDSTYPSMGYGSSRVYSTYSEADGTTADPKLVVVYQLPPSYPSDLQTEGQVNPLSITDTTPEFSAIYNDPEVGDIATHYQVQVSTSSAFSTIYWDTGKTALASTTPQGTRIADISYSGPALASSTQYYWRIKFWDDSDAEGAWNNEPAVFMIAGSAIPGAKLQDISYIYDAVGNIMQITDNSLTQAAKTVVFGYDDLHRLTSASTTAASSTPFSQTYTYNAIGNITNKSDVGSYIYAGNSGSNYANPHAATSINGGTYTYDNNGNLLTGGGLTNTWDYRNRLTQTVGSSTVTCGYDYQNNRVKYTNATGTTYYPNKLYNKLGATTTKHIFDNSGQMIATIEGNGTATTTHYTHTDHLSGSNVISDSSGNSEEIVDYYPFGSIRLDSRSNTFKEQRKFTGYLNDTDTGLNYAGARYQNPKIGRFISQDPAFLDVGDRQKFEQSYGIDMQKFLSDPQLLNSYSYARNNPIVQTDKNGEIIDTIADVGFIGYDLYSLGKAYYNGESTKGAWASLGLDIGGALIPGVTGLGFVAGHLDDVSKAGKFTNEAIKLLEQTNKSGKVLMEGVENVDVLKVIKDNYRVGSKIGKDGSTADAVIHEILTGEKVGGKLHSVKAQNEINRINNIINKYGSELKPQEQKVLNQISTDLKNALKTKK